MTLTIYDLSGRVVMTEHYRGGSTITVNVESLASGYYRLKVESSGVWYVVSVIFQ